MLWQHYSLRKNKNSYSFQFYFMSNGWFEFKHFTVFHDKCGMKVGTDGVLLGAWAAGGNKILDIGTGSGLISLMMSQRFPNAKITGIDIDENAIEQAAENVKRAGAEEHVEIIGKSVQEIADDKKYTGTFDAVISNPPYFSNSLKSPDCSRTLSRHNESLPFSDLVRCAKKLMSEDGSFSVILPVEAADVFLSECAIYGLFLTRRFNIKTVSRKPPKRCLLELGKHYEKDITEQNVVLNNSDGSRSEWYQELTSDFYKW